MSKKTLGFVYTGLALEMLHIMQSRLERLDVRKDDLATIMGNFIQVLLSVEFTNNLFKSQQTSTIAEVALKFRFEDCIAASDDFGMSSTSFETLYSLMVMGFKRQVVMSSSIGELVVAIRMNFAKVEKLTQKPAALASLGFFTKQFISAFQNMPPAQTAVLQVSLFQFLQRHRNQVSIFVQDRIQLLDGSFTISIAGPVPTKAHVPGTSVVYDEVSGEVVTTNSSFFKSHIYLSCTPHQTAARLAFNVNAYQQKYPVFPELLQIGKSTSNTQSQTDSMVLASLADSWESRNKLQQALERVAESKDERAEKLAMEQRESVLKSLDEVAASNEAEKTDEIPKTAEKTSKLLHLPHSNFNREQQSMVEDQLRHAEKEAKNKVEEYVVQRDSVTRLRNILRQECSDYDHIGKSIKGAAQISARNLPKRLYDCPREPPKILTSSSSSLISLAERLRYLDVDSTECEPASFPIFEDESAFVRKSLHHKLKHLPADQLQLSHIDAKSSVNSLQSRLRKLSDT